MIHFNKNMFLIIVKVKKKKLFHKYENNIMSGG